ncbi:MAG: DNA mismatch repair endonuclease MutL [Thermodesulfobacterium sp.]|nr:DNA mismatch repair endonuclease MutL [Thermodesulfobacterium sp.]
MAKIQILPEEIRGKIAAGEVVERPASVVKELVENAFDAKADFIKIGLKEGGIKEITVYDNGEGIEPEDLKLCYKHFATSKIKNLSDIFRIVTFGFRGEALASISQVSKLTITSKHADHKEAYEIKINFGKEVSFKPSRLNKGTLVKVRDLFSNLPARKAFLKTPRTETLRIMEIIKGLTLAHPEIKYEVKSLDENKEKTLFFWEGGSKKELLSYITGLEENFFNEILSDIPPYSIYLVLTDTSKTFSHTKYLYFLVNERWIKDEKLTKMILNVFKPFYGNLGFPAGVISIRAPYHLIDINVHPAKWEVRFKDEKTLFLALNKALEKLFGKKTFYYEREKPAFSGEIKEDLPLNYTEKPFSDSLRNKSPFLFPSYQKSFYNYLGTFLNTYILIEKDEELYIIDQHALSERIIFEDLKSKFSKSISQELLIPVLLRITESALSEFEEKKKALESLGFELELLNVNEVILKKIPSIIKEDIKDVLEKILEEPFSNIEELKLEVLRRYACLLARKKGDTISKEEIHFMIEKFLTHNLQTCPHGRPLYFKLSLNEIEEKLRRR